MQGSHVLVIDAGTSAVRCHLFHPSAGIVVSSASPWVYTQEAGAPDLARAFDPMAVWRGVSSAIRRCLAGRRVSAVAITSQRQALAFLDSDGGEIYVGPNVDLRAVFEGAAMDEDHRDEIYSVTGHTPAFMLAAGKLRWFQIHREEEYAKIAAVLSLGDWLSFKLSGVVASEKTLAAEAGLLDLETGRRADDLYRELGLSLNHVDLTNADDVMGRVSAQASEQTGLALGTPVVTAGSDTQCGLVGLGTISPQQAGIVAGWSASAQLVTARPIVSDGGETWAGVHSVADRWVLESSAGDMGNSLRWLKDTLIGGVDDAYKELDELAASAPLGADGAKAYLGAGRMDMSNLGMKQGGILFPVPLTVSGFNRQHIVRAALEGFAFAFRANVEQMERLSGEPASSIAIGGGMTQSLTFVRILAAVLGRPIRLGDDPRATAEGAALCGRVATGQYDSIEDAVGDAIGETNIEPEALDAANYNDLYQSWLDASQTLSELPI
ncbi:MAG: hypothetical protein CL694_11165 [Chloroflexi bacterium]|nr:hypothetical protein [Chloroflexota bacterium]MDP6421347.1 FGGY-family carbohydrate kinase [SAR202 cluster bacterium]MDP6665578.1 FGGY-family carbohydrate kinase [SAR202 cluster bacterium]HAL48059.1 hypothetical protein [Dehalococcoidia bacterium]